MRVHVTLAEDDFLEFNRFYMRESAGGKAVMGNLRRNLVTTILLVGAVMTLLAVLSDGMAAGLIIGAVTLLILGLLYPLFMWRVRQRLMVNARNTLRSDRNELFHRPSEVEIAPEHLIRENDLLYVRLSWKAVEGVYEGPQHVFIFLGSALGAYIIPLRCFATPDDAAAFAVAARRYFLDAHPESAA